MSAQPPGGPSLWDLLQARLGEHIASTRPQNVGLPRAMFNAAVGGINLPFEAGRHIGGDITGSLYAMSAQDTRATNPLDARIAAAYDQGGPAAAFEAARTDPRKEVSLTAGALGMLTDPTILVGGPLGKLGKVGEVADTLLSLPFKPAEIALGQIGRRAVAPAVLRARQALYGPVEGIAGNVPKSAGLIGPVPPPPLRAPPPLVPGPTSILDLARGGVPPAGVARVAPLPEALAPTRAPNLVREAAAAIPAPALHGPAVPPVRALEPEQLREALGNLMARRTTAPPPEAVALAEERALRPQPAPSASVESLAPEAIAPQEAVQAQGGALEMAPVDLAPTTREAGLAALSGRDTNTLLSIAYDHPNAVANAQRKYGDVGALRARAIERIQADRGRVARLAEADPDLAARVAALPDAEAAPTTATLAPHEAVQTATAAVPEASPVAEVAPPSPAARRVAPPEVRDARAALGRAEADMAAVRNRPVSGDADYLDKVRDEAVARGRYNAARRAATVAETRWRNGVYDRGGEAPGVPGAPLVTPLAAARTLGSGAAEASGRALSNLGTTGGDIAQAFRAGRTALREAGQAEAQGVKTAAQAEAAGLGHYVSGPRGPGQAVGDFQNQMRSNVVATFKNQTLDVLHTRGMLREYAPVGSDPAGAVDTIADELRANEAAPDAYARLSDSLRSAQERWGFEHYVPDLGQGQVGALAQEEAGRILPAAQRVINGTLMELRTKGPVGLLTLPMGAARGYLQPFTDAFFQRLNRLPQRAGREALYTLTGDANSFLAAHTFLGDLARRGVDVAPLAGKAFTPQQIEAVAGTQAANEWRSLLATVWGGAEAETKRVLGDFGERTALEKVPLIGRMFWLAGWSQRMLPIYAQVAARHPGVSMAVGGALANQAQGLKAEGLPPWAVGGIDTPLGRVNLLSPMPFSGELAGEALSALGGGDEGDRQTGYQKFKGIAGGLGLPLNPLIETGAYIAGQTGNQRPGDLDRYAGVENAVLPGPTVGVDYGAMLDKARQIVTGLGAGDLAAGKKPPASEADKEFARLVYERTGLPLADPRNIGAVIDSLADDDTTLAARWRKEAEANVAGRQGKQGVVSAVSPLTVSRIDPLQRAATIGRQNQPYRYEQISAAYDSGNRKAAALMQAANTASKAPDQRVYDAASEAQRLGLVKGFLAQQQAARRVPVSGDPYSLHNKPHGAGLP
jgi:hypothetical protein